MRFLDSDNCRARTAHIYNCAAHLLYVSMTMSSKFCITFASVSFVDFEDIMVIMRRETKVKDNFRPETPLWIYLHRRRALPVCMDIVQSLQLLDARLSIFLISQ